LIPPVVSLRKYLTTVVLNWFEVLEQLMEN